MPSERELVLLAGNSNPQLAKEISNDLSVPVNNPITRFANGEARVILPNSVRGKDVFIIQSTSPVVDRRMMELFIMLDAAKRAHAHKVTAVIPYYAYGRQDRKDQAHTAITAKLVAKLLETAGADHMVTLDVHSEQTAGFFEIEYDNLYGSNCLIPYLASLNIPNKKFVSPDLGGVSRAGAYSERLANGNEIAVVRKKRDVSKRNFSHSLSLIGDVDGVDAVIVDDQIDTVGTILDASKLLKNNGARKVIVVASHGLFSGNSALDRVNQPYIDKIIITNSIRQRREISINPKVNMVSVSSLLATAISRIHQEIPLSPGLID